MARKLGLVREINQSCEERRLSSSAALPSLEPGQQEIALIVQQDVREIVEIEKLDPCPPITPGAGPSLRTANKLHANPRSVRSRRQDHACLSGASSNSC